MDSTAVHGNGNQKKKTGGQAAVRDRSCFDGAFVRLPESYRGFPGANATDLFHASIAHIGAHLRFSGPRFPVGELKPIQLALISLIEDARVERLALEKYPGLLQLWLPFHNARPSGAGTAVNLMSRLARALIDPDYADADGWVDKGRRMFLDAARRRHDPAISRRIGALLGNDLGQMRIGFNQRTFVVTPPYRDDNWGLWEPDSRHDCDPQEQHDVLECVRIHRQESPNGKPGLDEPEPLLRDGPVEKVKAAEGNDSADAGILAARYPEWDHKIGRERPDWSTVFEVEPVPGPARAMDKVLEDHPGLVERISALIRAARVGRATRLRRRPEGDTLDLEACIESEVTRRRGETPSSRVYSVSARQHRDLSVLLLLDISESTNDRLPGGAVSVLSVEKEAAALLAHAMSGLGDDFAIHAFNSNGRDAVRYQRIKDFNRPYDDNARSRLAGLKGGYSTRMGTALRHAGMELLRQRSHRRLILVVTDGEPSDVDVLDKTYLAEDARKVVMSLGRDGIDVFAVGLDSGADSYLPRIFGQRNIAVIQRVGHLPERLPMLYFRLTA